MKWAYGVTAVSSRMEYLPRTLASLKLAGFESPRLFMDGDPGPIVLAGVGIDVSVRSTNIRTFGNWYLGLAELYIRDPSADRYAIFQDDVVACKNLRGYLNQVPFPDTGYWNLLTFPREEIPNVRNYHNHSHPVPPDGAIGFYPSDQKGKSACGLVFNQKGVRALLGHNMILDRPKAADGYKCLDGAIVSAMANMGWLEYVHNPSLLFHIGRISSLRHPVYPDARTFRGEDFDALDLLKEAHDIKDRPPEPPTPLINSLNLGDTVERCLNMIGITKDRVESWLQRPCNGCAERKRRLNRLGWWCQEILSGRIEEARNRFEQMLND